MKQILSIVFFIIFSGNLFSQQEKTDSSQTLQEVTIRAFEQNRKLMQVPAAIVTVSKNQLSGFNNTNILPAINSNPGIKMEERSPGSYRLNIRGSSLRSPFGVRNVKTYYNDIPYTDPGGNTYLNQLGFYNIQSMEIIKGPGSSLYGAGTGGVLLLKTNELNWKPGLAVDYSWGSFGLKNFNANAKLGTNDLQNTVNYLQLSSDGYRNHSNLDRKVFTWDLNAKISDKAKITTHFLWGDLFYQTPGALTKAEYLANPKAARPRVGQSPGAVESKAAIYQKLFLTGISLNHKFNDHWQNTSSVYGAATRLLNPSIRNYGRTSEPNYGGRTFFDYSTKVGNNSKMSLVTGAEFQQGISSVRIYANKNGNPDTLQTDDEINNRVFFAFTQASFEFMHGWFATAGLSLYSQNLSIIRLSTVPSVEQKREYKNELAPRIAILKQLAKPISIYASISRGFSPPTTAEVLPSSGIISTDLNAEYGTSYESGFRGTLYKGKIYYDINAFWFGLNNTIVQRRDQAGADYFVNAGSTRQQGIESSLSWQLINNQKQFFSNAKLRLSHTWSNFSYENFKQLNTDYSGKELPGIAPHVFAAGFDLSTKSGVYINVNYYYSDPIPLNDANSEYAGSYNLLGSRIGWKKNLHPKLMMELFLAADNIFDVQYSLGNDINAFGGRYYNAAPAFNMSGGISLRFNFR